MDSNYDYLKKHEILRAIEVCKLLGVCRRTLINYKNRSGLPFHQIANGRPFYLKEEILEWVANQKSSPRMEERKVVLTVDGFIHE